jgi:hypothetical protein
VSRWRPPRQPRWLYLFLDRVDRVLALGRRPWLESGLQFLDAAEGRSWVPLGIRVFGWFFAAWIAYCMARFVWFIVIGVV